MLDFGFYNMDCLKGMAEFPDGYFDLAVCDPPYGIGVMTMNYTTSGSERKYGYTAANRRDYRKQGQWDVAPDKSYFDELFIKTYIVSKEDGVWI